MTSLPYWTAASATRTSPEGRSTAYRQPAAVRSEVTSPKPLGADPSANSFLPEPRTTGATIRRYSSTRPASWSVWTSPQLPWTYSSRPGCSLRSVTAATTSESITVVLFQVGSVSVCETTCLGRVLSAAATVSSGSVTSGQKPANSP